MAFFSHEGAWWSIHNPEWDHEIGVKSKVPPQTFDPKVRSEQVVTGANYVDWEKIALWARLQWEKIEQGTNELPAILRLVALLHYNVNLNTEDHH